MNPSNAQRLVPITLKLTQGEYALVREQALSRNMSITAYVRWLMVEADKGNGEEVK